MKTRIRVFGIILFLFFLSVVRVMTREIAAEDAVAPQETPQQEKKEPENARLRWFAGAKLGVFIHWGIYAVNGIDESWSFFNEYISYEDYMKQLQGFDAGKYNADYWAELIAGSGARYAVLTSRHHDGVALWDSAFGHLNVKSKTPARRDLIDPFCRAMRKKNIKVGLYYSLPDWSHPDYPHFTKSIKRYQPEREPQRWERFITFSLGQLRELAARYHPDLFWFDGDWEQDATTWRASAIRQMLLEIHPGVIMNSRLSGFGDYATLEQSVPVLPPGIPCWELCLTMNDSWGFQPHDRNYKTPNQLLRIFADCISMGGNLLLDIGPRADGSIPPEQEAILHAFGRWTRKHAQAVYDTGAGIPFGHFHGPTTLSPDRRILYLFQEHKPNGPLLVKGLKNTVHRTWVVGNGAKLKCTVINKQYWSNVPGFLYIDLPSDALDEQITVIALLLDGPVDLYRGDGDKIESK